MATESADRSRSRSPMPLRFAVGTQKAFEKGQAFVYRMHTISGEDVYICNTGSEWAQKNEFLVLRKDGDTWTAWDSMADSTDNTTVQCRQPVFRCKENITVAGWHFWQSNYAASTNNDGSAINWKGRLSAETKYVASI